MPPVPSCTGSSADLLELIRLNVEANTDKLENVPVQEHFLQTFDLTLASDGDLTSKHFDDSGISSALV